MSAITKGFRIALCQFGVGKNKAQNITTALQNIRTAAIDKGAKLVALPECFNSPYGIKYFNDYAEEIPNGETSTNLSNIAKELNIYLVGGTIPERDTTDNKLYNTCTIWGPDGSLLGKYRKVHLFDINVKTGISFKESDSLSPGNKLTIFEIDGCKIGLGICYDMRFVELSRLYRKQGCQVLLFPGAFSKRTGELHWELLGRARATDQQCFVAMVSPSRDPNGEYVAWGHSMVIDPWGEVLQTAGESDEVIVQDIDLSKVQEVREQIPIGSQWREDLYDTIIKDPNSLKPY